MHNPRTCMNCLRNTMEFVTYKDMAFCDTDCLVAFIREHGKDGSRPTQATPDRLPAALTEVALGKAEIVKRIHTAKQWQVS